MKGVKSHPFVIGCILVCVSSRAWAQTVSFGQTQSGTVSTAAQTNAYTFSANASDVVDFTLVATTGSLVPKIQLYNSVGTLISSNYSGAPFGCSGSTVEMNTVQIPATGTFTVVVSDCSSTNTGDYVIYTQRTNNPSGAANLPFAQVQTGAITSPAQSDTYTFSANANVVVDFTMYTSSGGLVPKIRLYNPNGTLNSSNYSGAPFGCSGSTLEMNTVTLPVTGTYTMLVGDCGDTKTGNYEIYAQSTDSPAGPVGLLFGQVQAGSITSATQSNTYTFSANASDVVDFTLVTTNGSLVPKIRLYNPNGTLNSSNYSGAPFGCGGSTLEMNTATLPVTGTYTLLVGDCGDTNTGTYSIYSQRTNNPTEAVNLPFAQVQTGLVGSVPQSYTYTFAANASDLVDFTLVTTNSSLVPKIRLYNPNGTLNSSNYSGAPFGCGGSTLEMNTATLIVSGTYTVLVGDCGDTNTGNFAIYLQRTNNPTGAVPVLWGQVQTGTIGSVAQSSTYTFNGTANDGVEFTMVTTGGSLVPKIRLYNPNGTLNSSNYSGAPFGCAGTSVQLGSVTLTQTGTYTVLVGDCADSSTGNYNFSSQCFGTCQSPAAVSLSATNLSFGNQLVGTSSTPQSVTLTNTGNATLSFSGSGITITGANSGDFSQTNTCGASVAAGANCSITVAFKPTATGSRSASVSITDNASGSPQNVTLSGMGTAPIVSFGGTTSLNFGNQLVGSMSAAQTVTLTNTGTATLTISGPGITIGGSNSGDFAETNTCGSSVVAGANCTVSVTFKPTATGARNASLSVTDNASGSPQSISLTGTGVTPAVTLSPTSVTFAGQLITTTSSAQSVTLTNSGTAALTISSIAITGTNASDFAQTNTCPASSGALAVNANCTISVTFTPSATGNRTASVTTMDNASGNPHAVSLAGTGTDFSLDAASGSNCPSGGNCSTSATISAGQTATYNLQVTPSNGFNGAVALACSGAPGNSTCTVSPASLPPAGSTSYAFTVTIGNTSNVMLVPQSRFRGIPELPNSYALLLLPILVFAFWAAKLGFTHSYAHRALVPAMAALFLCVLYSAACGGGGGGGGGHQPPTNAVLKVTGTSNGVNRTLSLNLTVNH